MNPVFDSFAMYGLVNGGYEMPTHLEKTTYPPTEATTTDSSDDSDDDMIVFYDSEESGSSDIVE